MFLKAWLCQKMFHGVNDPGPSFSESTFLSPTSAKGTNHWFMVHVQVLFKHTHKSHKGQRISVARSLPSLKQSWKWKAPVSGGRQSSGGGGMFHFSFRGCYPQNCSIDRAPVFIRTSRRQDGGPQSPAAEADDGDGSREAPKTWVQMAQTPRGGLYGPPSKRHLGGCAIYSETAVLFLHGAWTTTVSRIKYTVYCLAYSSR